MSLTDEDDDDGQMLIRKTHMNLWLRWAKKTTRINETLRFLHVGSKV